MWFRRNDSICLLVDIPYFIQAYTVIQSSLQQGKLGGSSDTEKQKQLFLAYLNNADTGTEYLNRLHNSIQVHT